MSDRKIYFLRYEDIEYFERYDEEVKKTVEEDQGRPADATRTFPPIYAGLTLSAEAADKLRELEGVVLQEIPDDE
ncbi:hypothetical protein DTO271G3_681 [Paecilomyces variotii]|nr:hypothetical protein DTO271G3_681 [Paecilomyces variotii]